jgi:hypothetical protein
LACADRLHSLESDRRVAWGVGVSACSKPALVFVLLGVLDGTLDGCGGSGKRRGGTVDFLLEHAPEQALLGQGEGDRRWREARACAGLRESRAIHRQIHRWTIPQWRPTRIRAGTAANTREATRDPKAVYNIGEVSSNASAVSMPILNQAAFRSEPGQHLCWLDNERARQLAR